MSNFDFSNNKSKFNQFLGKGKLSKHLKHLPMQIKALVLSSDESVRFPIKKMDFDPFLNPNTSEAFEQNFLNIKELQYFAGFRFKKNGLRDLESPIFFKMNDKAMEKRELILCRLKDYENDHLEIKSDKSIANTNSVFLIGDE